MSGYTTFITGGDELKSEKPYSWFGAPVDGIASTNFSKAEAELKLIDVNTLPAAEQPTMASHGFCFLKHYSKELAKLNANPKEDYQSYIDELGEWLKTIMPEAKLIMPHNQVIRGPTLSGYASSSHVDMVPTTAWWYIEGMLTQDELQSVLSGKYRARLMNVWRPRVYPVEDNGLALLDPHSIKNLEIEYADVLIPGSHADIFAQVKNEPGQHRWMYMREQSPDDAILFCKYDTHPPKGMPTMFGMTTHAAVRDGSAKPDARPRQSVETSWIILEPAPYEHKPTIQELVPADTRKQPWSGKINMPERPKYAPARSLIGEKRWQEMQAGATAVNA